MDDVSRPIDDDDAYRECVEDQSDELLALTQPFVSVLLARIASHEFAD
jgi:hypothetical protein